MYLLGGKGSLRSSSAVSQEGRWVDGCDQGILVDDQGILGGDQGIIVGGQCIPVVIKVYIW